MDEKRIDELIRGIRRIDRLLQSGTKTLIDVSSFAVERGETVPHYIAEEWQPPAPKRTYRITQAMCCSTLQRLWVLNRRFPWIENKNRAKLKELAREFPKFFIDRNAPRATFASDEDVRVYIKENLGSSTFGALNPLTASSVFWALMYAGESYAHRGLGFLSFFSMLWALHRRHKDATLRGAALEPWRPTAYITAKCLFPIEMLIGTCRRRSERLGEIGKALEALQACAGKSGQYDRWQFAFHLDTLTSLLHETAMIAVSRSAFERCAKHVGDISASLTAIADTQDKWEQVRGHVAKLLGEIGNRTLEVVDDATPVVEDLLPRLIAMITKPSKRSAFLKVCHQFQGIRDNDWDDLARSARVSRDVCKFALDSYRAAAGEAKLVTPSTDAATLIKAFHVLADANEKVADEIEESVSDSIGWCRLVVAQETARASASNDTDFDSAELVNAMAIAVRAGGMHVAEVRDSLEKALNGADSDGSWSAGKPFYIQNRVLGAWSTTSELIWTLASAIVAHPEIDLADADLMKFVEWLERTMTEVKWEQAGAKARRVVGWSSERFRQPKTIDLWATCGAINALLPIRTLLEYRLWQICESTFTVIEEPRPLHKIDPVDLDRPHRERLHRRLMECGWRTAAREPDDAEYSFVLHGPPGSSKTTIAGALALQLWKTTQFAKRPEPFGSSGPRMVRITPADFMHSGESNIDHHARLIFKLLSHVRGVTIFFDEIDDLLRRRQLGEEPTFIKLVAPAMLNRLQDLRDACPSQEVCFVIGTNFVQKLDPALIRPGRIDCTLKVVYPDLNSKRAIAEKMNVPADRIEELLPKTEVWPWATFSSACKAILKNPTLDVAAMLDPFTEQAKAAEEYYFDPRLWKDLSRYFVDEYVSVVNAHGLTSGASHLNLLLASLTSNEMPKALIAKVQEEIESRSRLMVR